MRRPRVEPPRPRLELLIAELAPGTTFDDVDATGFALAQPHRFPGSPTVHVEGRDVDPSFQDPGDDYTPRCRLYWTAEGLRGVPERAWIERARRESLERHRRAVK